MVLLYGRIKPSRDEWSITLCSVVARGDVQFIGMRFVCFHLLPWANKEMQRPTHSGLIKFR
jgi:hypothetical protein